jgi:hypothetical protein
MYLIEIVCATVVIYAVVQIQKCWCKFQAHNTTMQDHAVQERGYRQPSELVLGNIQPKECGEHSSMQVPIEETNAGSTASAELAP